MAQAKISELKAQVVAVDFVKAEGTLGEIGAHTSNAVRLTSDPIWRTGEVVPFVGSNLSAVRKLAKVTDDIVAEVVEPLVGVASNINPGSLAPKDGGIDPKPFIDAVPAVAQANAGAKEAIRALKAVDTEGTISQVASARNSLTEMLGSIAPLLQTADEIVPLIPPAMGVEAPRRYVVMFQNNAEGRALGGTALSFALVTVDSGRVELTSTVAAGFENFDRYGTSVVPIPDGAQDVYPGGAYGTFIPNVTIRPSFVSAAEMTQEMWHRQFGYTVDGIISIDPVALSYILRASAPITLSTGDVLTSDSLVPFLLNDVYTRFNSKDVVADNLKQDAIYGEAVVATFAQLTSGAVDPKTLLASLLQGWNERRVLYWSAHPEEQATLASFGLNGELPVSDAATDRVGVYFQDNVGSKLGYYLQQSVHLAAESCRPDGRQNYRVTAALTNLVDPGQVAGLSPSITGNYKAEKLKPGVQRMISMLYAPPGSQIAGITVNGSPVAVEPLHDTDRPVGKVTLVIQPGETVSVSYDVIAAEPGKKALEAQVTPMVRATEIVNEPLDCATVPAG